MAIKSRYIPINPEKYIGDVRDIICRSMWERAVCKWCDLSDFIVAWGSETTVIPYRCATDRRMHRYFIDFHIVFKNGLEWIVEVKPEKEMSPPKKRTKKTTRYQREARTFLKNKSKWDAAKIFAESRGMKFYVFTEKSLKSLGLSIVGSK